MKNGMEAETKFIDEQGSTVTTEKKYHSGGVLSKPIRRYFEMNHKVTNIKEEHEALLKISEENSKDKTRLDPQVKWRFTKHGNDGGYYLIVECYTRLEY